jgi:hypothetical protein
MRRAKTIIHVNQFTIKANTKNGTNDPPLIVRRGNKAVYAHEIEITGTIKFMHSPSKPLRCGARVWAETMDEVKVLS